MKCASGDSCSVEFPEPATWRAHPRDLSTPPQSTRFFVVGRDDRSLFSVLSSGPPEAACCNSAYAGLKGLLHPLSRRNELDATYQSRRALDAYASALPL